jgi:hypothetical protein
MRAFVQTNRSLGKAVIKAVLAVACTVGLVLSAAVDRAGAGKGGGNKALTWGATKAPGSKVVRDHRAPTSWPGGVKVRGAGGVWWVRRHKDRARVAADAPAGPTHPAVIP